DGTLLDSQSRLSAENIAAITEAAERGIEIVIVTGRRFHSARWTVDALPCDFHVIATNGALVKSKDGTTLQRHLLPAHIARRVLDATEEFRPCAGVIFDRLRERQVIFEKIDWDGPYVGPYLSRHRDFVAEIAPLTDCLDEDPLEVMFLGECDRLARVMKLLENLPHANDYTLAQTVYADRNLSMLDVLQKGVNKGSALAAWAQHLGIARDEVMALGDNWNDREMLEYAGLPVAMGNCVPELRDLGCQMTLSNDASGVAHAIRKFALNGNHG
ncbi:MAG TPA: Cof-type HAD-IIB family hydrolase, partial [Candidatus Acidoferrales bacterium]